MYVRSVSMNGGRGIIIASLKMRNKIRKVKLRVDFSAKNVKIHHIRQDIVKVSQDRNPINFFSRQSSDLPEENGVKCHQSNLCRRFRASYSAVKYERGVEIL